MRTVELTRTQKTYFELKCVSCCKRSMIAEFRRWVLLSIFILSLSSMLLVWNATTYGQPESTAEDEMRNLIAKSLQSEGVTLYPVEENCIAYQEFRHLNFLHPVVKHKLCSNANAYELFRGEYPLCLLPSPFNADLLNIVARGSETVDLKDVQELRIPMFVYKGKDLISDTIRSNNVWEPQHVNWTLGFTQNLSDVTFLDMGCNIGVYSLQAAKLGLRVVALDANIRNLLRLRLSLTASSLDADLVWNFISPDQSLKYLSFLADCNVGGAGRETADLPDTVPVMPLRTERICDLIKTKNVVIKMDIQGGETDFLLTSGRLFTEFNVAAVQMEWSPSFIRGNDSHILTSFFIHRGYKIWRFPSFSSLDLEDMASWVEMDIIWIHKNFLSML